MKFFDDTTRRTRARRRVGAAIDGRDLRSRQLWPGAGDGEAGDAQDAGRRRVGLRRLGAGGRDGRGGEPLVTTGDPGELAMSSGWRQPRRPVQRHRRPDALGRSVRRRRLGVLIQLPSSDVTGSAATSARTGGPQTARVRPGPASFRCTVAPCSRAHGNLPTNREYGARTALVRWTAVVASRVKTSKTRSGRASAIPGTRRHAGCVNRWARSDSAE